MAPDREIIGDYGELGEADLAGHDCVMHLAAISNDPMGDLDPALTYRTNRDSSIALAQRAKAAGVGRFLFSGSCSIYGKGAHLDVDEHDELNPVSAYAFSKIETETAVAKLADASFSPTYLRNATAYGYSPSLRIDLVANNLLTCALTLGEIRIMSDGTPWRPLIHCKDIARAFVAFLNAPTGTAHNLALNVGSNQENFQVRDVANEISRLMPHAKIKYTGEVGADPRNYRVKFDLLGRTLPGFALSYSLRSGLEELYRKCQEHGFSLADFQGDRFVRLRTLKKKLQLNQKPAGAR